MTFCTHAAPSFGSPTPWPAWGFSLCEFESGRFFGVKGTERPPAPSNLSATSVSLGPRGIPVGVVDRKEL